MDIAHAFDSLVPRMQHKLEHYLPTHWSEDLYSELRPISVPQGHVLAQLLYLLETYDISLTKETTIATLSDSTSVFVVDRTRQQANERLQKTLKRIDAWIKH